MKKVTKPTKKTPTKAPAPTRARPVCKGQLWVDDGGTHFTVLRVQDGSAKVEHTAYGTLNTTWYSNVYIRQAMRLVGTAKQLKECW
jgi:hypothetical protein